ncbi:hypothetical protein [Campylobacter concisus]
MKEMYLNAGLIKNYDFDSIVIGSSMTQNFILDEVKYYLGFDKPIKLTLAGGNIIEYNTFLTNAINKKNVKNILFGLDIFSLDTKESRLPQYLYDESIINDLRYVVNLDTFKRSVVYPIFSILSNPYHPRFNFNLMYQWQHVNSDNDFSEKKLLEQFKKNNINFRNNGDQEKIFRERINNFNILFLDIIKNNKNINFYIFYPPYSILSYKAMDSENLRFFIKIKEYINDALLKYDNVKIYDFQDNSEIITNLNNYKDLTHYHQKINSWILKEMGLDKERIKQTGSSQDLLKIINSYNIPIH